MDDYDAMIEQVRRAKKIIIASHYSPDGDGIGSSIALYIALTRMGKDVTLYNRDSVPANLGFLPHIDRFTKRLNPEERFDMAIMVDCASRSRVSDDFLAHEGLGAVACIDHHQLDKVDADMLLLDGSAASAGEVVMRFMRRAGITVDAAPAQCIYTTLVVDTGFFKYSSTNAQVLALASELVSAGAEPWTVAKHLDESYPASRMRLLAKSLATLELSLDGHYATMEVTAAMLRETGALMEHSDEFATYPRAIEGVEVAALFREMGEGAIKVSLRSKDIVNVASLARSMGGGGHPRAAGVRIRTTMPEARKRIYDAVKVALENPDKLDS